LSHVAVFSIFFSFFPFHVFLRLAPARIDGRILTNNMTYDVFFAQ